MKVRFFLDGKLVGETLMSLGGMNYQPDQAEWERDARKVAIEDGLVSEKDAPRLKIEFTREQKR